MKTVAKVLRLAPNDWEVIKKEAQRLGMTNTGFIRWWIKQYFDSYEDVNFQKRKRG